jgi:hypothetical protein
VTDRARFADCAFAFDHARSEFEDRLLELLGDGADYENTGWDIYDESLEINKVTDDTRLSEEAQKFIAENGFARTYVNHKNGWETHYVWKQGEPFKPSRGWRRKATPTGFEINYWPEEWNSPHVLAWLKSGYVKIVGDV